MTKIPTPEPLARSVVDRLHPGILPSPHLISHHPRISPNRQQNQQQPTAQQRQPRRPLSPAALQARAAEREEMHALLAKLKELVPSLNRRRKCSRLTIIQRVIDYIFDLQHQVETHPISQGRGGESAASVAAMEFISLQLSQQHQQQQGCQQSDMSSACDPAAAYQQQARIPQGKPERQPLASIML